MCSIAGEPMYIVFNPQRNQMLSSFTSNQYLLKKQALALTGIFRIYDANGQMVAYSKQKMFKLKEDIRVYADEEQTMEILMIKARSILDFSAAYDVFDSRTQQLIGTLRRKGLRSILRDQWEVLSPYDQVVGTIEEDSMGRALLRRFLLGKLLPQDYDMIINGQRAMDLRQRWHFFRYELEMTFEPASQVIDRRLGIAAGILLAAIEGKQDDN